MTKTVGTWFCGIGGSTLGAIAAGYQPIWGVDNWEAAWWWYHKNIGGYSLNEDVRTINMGNLGTPDVFLASPTCCNFSTAKVGGEESELDIEIAQATARVIRNQRPPVVVIENVPDYMKPGCLSYGIITKQLDESAYHWVANVYDCADFGLPQNRKRMIIRAALPTQAKIKPLETTHSKNGENGRKLWVGWHSYVADLWDGLEPSVVTEAQLAQLRKKQCPPGDYLIQRVGYRTHKTTHETKRGGPAIWPAHLPVGAIRASLTTDGKTDTDPRGNTRKKFMDWVQWDGQTAIARNVNMKIVYRLMGFCDSIRYPDDIRDACRLAGNAVPPILMKKVLETIHQWR